MAAARKSTAEHPLRCLLAPIHTAPAGWLACAWNQHPLLRRRHRQPPACPAAAQGAVHRREGGGQERQAAALQGHRLPPHHPKLHAAVWRLHAVRARAGWHTGAAARGLPTAAAVPRLAGGRALPLPCPGSPVTTPLPNTAKQHAQNAADAPRKHKRAAHRPHAAPAAATARAASRSTARNLRTRTSSCATRARGCCPWQTRVGAARPLLLGVAIRVPRVARAAAGWWRPRRRGGGGGGGVVVVADGGAVAVPALRWTGCLARDPSLPACLPGPQARTPTALSSSSRVSEAAGRCALWLLVGCSMVGSSAAAGRHAVCCCCCCVELGLMAAAAARARGRWEVGGLSAAGRGSRGAALSLRFAWPLHLTCASPAPPGAPPPAAAVKTAWLVSGGQPRRRAAACRIARPCGGLPWAVPGSRVGPWLTCVPRVCRRRMGVTWCLAACWRAWMWCTRCGSSGGGERREFALRSGKKLQYNMFTVVAGDGRQRLAACALEQPAVVGRGCVWRRPLPLLPAAAWPAEHISTRAHPRPLPRHTCMCC